MGKSLELLPGGSTFTVVSGGESYEMELAVPGRHNASNALAALAAARELGVSLEDGVVALQRFEGLKRRLETVGAAGGITVIDDFAHNPDKIDASLATMRAQPGRILIFFQPHGYGPLAKMGEELAASFVRGMAEGDRLFLPDPVYQGGTVDRSRGSEWLAEAVRAQGGNATHAASRDAAAAAILAEARDGDRILIMGARDDSLSEFAAELVEKLG
jgi:UDP-N-acetylmuramate--alanine ligase